MVWPAREVGNKQMPIITPLPAGARFCLLQAESIAQQDALIFYLVIFLAKPVNIIILYTL